MGYLTLIPPLLSLLVFIYKRLTRISIGHIRGPPSQSFLVGNLHEFFSSQAGECDFRWQEEFGDIVRIKAPLGEDRLIISDPKALHYIYNAAGYDFAKPPARRELARVISGNGVTSAEGGRHKRLRKVMMPGFGSLEAKALYPIFRRYAYQLSDKWKDIIERTGNGAVINVSYWFCRATLDAIGEAAFDYRFRTLDNDENILGQAYFRLRSDQTLPSFLLWTPRLSSTSSLSTYGLPSRAAVLLQGLTDHLPTLLVRLMFDYAPMKGLLHARMTEKVANQIAEKLIDAKVEAIEHGEKKRDILSILVGANMSADYKLTLSKAELVSQMRTLLFTGHETSANSLSWTLFELARNLDMQGRLRREIRDAERAVRARGDQGFTITDLERMPYLNAIIKESFRMYPVGIHSFRQATKDCALPLSKPLLTTTGQLINELPIPRGVNIITSIMAYNRNKDIFGDDSHTFKPDRWLSRETEPSSGQKVGVYHNLMTFAGGVRTCPGWRMALVEVQAFIVELINTFEFELTDEARQVRRESALVMVPTVPGQLDKGAQLPLRIRLAARE